MATPHRIWKTRSHQYSVFQTNVTGLDTSNPYGFENEQTFDKADPGQVEVFSDAPSAKMLTTAKSGDGVDAVDLSIDDAFTLFLMFNAGGDSIDVPLATSTWKWHVELSDTIGEPKFVGLHPSPALSGVSATAKFPEWTYLVDWKNIVKDK